jgi:hypothetical protein
MLEPPISQADIDNRTLFRTRGGGTARVIAMLNGAWWLCERLDGAKPPHDSVLSSGKYFSPPTATSDYDLISRIPEPNMESQAVVEDRRQPGYVSPVVFLESIGDGNLFEMDGQIFRKLSDELQERLTGCGAPCFTLLGTLHNVIPMTGLRLRMILEPKPA